MRRIITCLIALLFFSLQISAQQVPNGFNYQSIARDAMGLPIVNSQIKLRITVRQNSISGTDVWQETQTAITNQFGLINLVIGNGTKSGGLASITGINSIDWSSDNFFIVVEVDNGGAYVSLGITQFQSVPYALASDNTLKIQGTKVGAIIPTANQFLKFNSLSGQWEPGNISGANGGTVISVGGIGPISITGNAGLAPQVNILQSSAIQDGYLSALDWAVFANKLGTTTGFSGNVSGTYNALTVTGIQNIPVTPTAPTNGQILMYDGIQWVPTTTGATSGVTTVIGSGEISVSPGSSPVISILTASGISNGIITTADYISFSNKLTINSIAGGDLSGPYNNLIVTKIGGVPVSLASAPTGSVLSFNGIGFVPAVLTSTVNITSTTPGVSASGSTINITTADGTNFGLLTPTDYSLFTNKVGIASSATGDVSGSYQDGFTVTGLGTKSLNITGILPGQVLSFNGTSFVPGTPSASQLTSVTGINGIIVGGTGSLYSVDGSNLITVTTLFGGDLNGTYNNITVNKVQNVPFSLAGIINGQYLYFNGTSIVGFNVPSAVVPTLTGINGITLNTNTGYNFTISGQTLSTYSGDNLLTTLTGTFPNFTIAGISQAQNATTLVGINGLSVAGSSFSQTIIGQSFVGANGIVVSSTGNVFTITNTTPGLSLFGDGINTSVTGGNNNYTVLGIAANQILNTISGINGIKIVTGTGFDFSIDGTNFITSIIGSNGLTVFRSGQFFTVAGANTIAATYSGDNLLTTLTGTFPNLTIAGIAQSIQNITLTGSNGLSVSGSGLSQTVIGQNFVGTNGIVISSTGRTFTISNTTPGLSLFGDGVNTSVTGSNNNYTVLGIGSGSQWISSGSDKIYTNSFVGIGAANPGNPLVVQSNIVSDIAFFESFDPAGSTIRVYNGGTDGARIKLESGSTFILENRVSVVGFNFSGSDFLTFNNVNSTVGINAIGGVVNIGRSGQSSNLSVTGTTYTKSLKINSLSNGILTVDGLGNVTTTSLSFSTTQTTLTGANGLSVSGSGFSQTIIGQSFIAGSGIVITSSGNNFTIINTIPGLNLFGDNINTSVVGSNNNYSVLGIGISSQWISTTAGIFVNSFVGIGTDAPLSKLHVTNGKVVIQSSSSVSGQLQIGGTNPGDNAQIVFVGGVATGLGTNVASSTSDGYNAVWGLGIGMDGIGTSKFGFYNAGLNANIFVIQSDGNFGINEYNPGEKLTVKGNSSISGISFTNDLRAITLSLTGIGSGILTVDGFGNVTTTSLSFANTQTTLTGFNGISVSGSGFSQTIIGQSFIGTNGIVVSSTGNTFTISNTTPGLSLFGDGVNTSVVGTNNNFTVLGIGATSQWVSTTGGIYYPIGVGINALPLTAPSTAPLTIGTSSTWDIAFVPGGGGSATIHSVQDLILLSDNNLAFKTNNVYRLNILTTGEVGIGTQTPNEELTVQGNSSVSGIGYASGFKASTLTLTGIGSGILTVDGFGNITTTSLNLISSQWINTTSGIYYNNSVGIGTGNPQYPLHISTTTTNASIKIDDGFDAAALFPNGIEYAHYFAIKTNTFGGVGNHVGGNVMLFDMNNNVAIGNLTNADERLTVQGNSSVTGIGYSAGIKTQTLTLTGIGSGILTVDGFGNVTTTSLSFATTQTTLTGSKGLSVSGSGFSQTIIGQSFIGSNGIVVSSTGNTFTITNTIPGFSLFGDGTITSVVGSNNNYTVLGIGSSSQWINTLSGIYYSSVVGIGIVPASNSGLIVKSPSLFNNALTLKESSGTYNLFEVRDNPSGVEVSFYGPSNTINAVISGDAGVSSYIINEFGIGTSTPNEKLTIQGNSSVSGIGYASGLKAATLTLTGIGSGILTVDGFGNVTTTSLNLTASQWINTTAGIYYNNSVGIGTGNPQYPLHISTTTNASIKIDDGSFIAAAFFPTGIEYTNYFAIKTNTFGGVGNQVGGNVMLFDVNNNVAIGNLTDAVERLTVDGNSSVTGIGYFAGVRTKTLTLTGIGSGILTVDGFGNVTTTSLPVFAQTATTLTGINGISVITGTGYDFTIDGSAFVNTTTAGLKDVKGNFQNGFTVTGLVGAPINTAAILPGYALQFDGTSIVGSSFINTIVGTGGLTVGTITGGYSMDGSNLSSGTIIGTAGLSVVGSGLSKTVSGAGLVVLQQSLGSTMGSAATTFNTTSGTAMFKVPVKIPANVKTVSISLNAYGLVGSSSADYVVIIGGNASPVSVNSNNPDNIVSLPDLDVSPSQGQIVLLKVFGKVSGAETAAYLQGITITVKD